MLAVIICDEAVTYSQLPAVIVQARLACLLFLLLVSTSAFPQRMVAWLHLLVNCNHVHLASEESPSPPRGSGTGCLGAVKGVRCFRQQTSHGEGSY